MVRKLKVIIDSIRSNAYVCTQAFNDERYIAFGAVVLALGTREVSVSFFFGLFDC